MHHGQTTSDTISIRNGITDEVLLIDCPWERCGPVRKLGDYYITFVTHLITIEPALTGGKTIAYYTNNSISK